MDKQNRSKKENHWN